MSLPSWLRSAFESLSSPMVMSFVGSVSLLMLIVSLVAIPWVLCRLPEGYLVEEPEREPHGLAKRVLRNVLGGLLLIVGLLMLVLPGQGLLTIFVGFTLIDFPKKREWIKRLLARPRLLKVINSVRERFHHAPLRAAADQSRASGASKDVTSIGPP